MTIATRFPVCLQYLQQLKIVAKICMKKQVSTVPLSLSVEAMSEVISLMTGIQILWYMLTSKVLCNNNTKLLPLNSHFGSNCCLSCYSKYHLWRGSHPQLECSLRDLIGCECPDWNYFLLLDHLLPHLLNWVVAYSTGHRPHCWIVGEVLASGVFHYNDNAWWSNCSALDRDTIDHIYVGITAHEQCSWHVICMNEHASWMNIAWFTKSQHYALCVFFLWV